LVWTCTENGRKYKSQKSITYEFGNRLRSRPRNRWQDEVREDGIVGGEEWQEKVYNKEEWKSRERRGIVPFNTCQWNE
jgi:hypothetical protein